MARVLSHDDPKDEDLCADFEDECTGKVEKPAKKRPVRRLRPIPIANVTVDCTPVSFRTPGQVINVVSCPVTEVIPVPITRTVDVNLPVGLGCFLSIPFTETVTVPVLATVNVPPLLIPAPVLVCPPLLFGAPGLLGGVGTGLIGGQAGGCGCG